MKRDFQRRDDGRSRSIDSLWHSVAFFGQHAQCNMWQRKPSLAGTTNTFLASISFPRAPSFSSAQPRHMPNPTEAQSQTQSQYTLPFSSSHASRPSSEPQHQPCRGRSSAFFLSPHARAERPAAGAPGVALLHDLTPVSATQDRVRSSEARHTTLPRRSLGRATKGCRKQLCVRLESGYHRVTGPVLPLTTAATGSRTAMARRRSGDRNGRGNV